MPIAAPTRRVSGATASCPLCGPSPGGHAARTALGGEPTEEASHALDNPRGGPMIVPGIGSDVEVTEGAITTPRKWGDAECDGDVDAVDALLILRFVAGLAVNLPAGCPLVG